MNRKLIIILILLIVIGVPTGIFFLSMKNFAEGVIAEAKGKKMYMENGFTDSTITVTGKAENAKAGATVISNDDQKIYYLDGLAFWDQNMVGKIVQVTGKKIVEEKSAQKDDKLVRQQMTGIKRTILNPRWVLIRTTNTPH